MTGVRDMKGCCCGGVMTYEKFHGAPRAPRRVSCAENGWSLFSR